MLLVYKDYCILLHNNRKLRYPAEKIAEVSRWCRERNIMVRSFFNG